MTDTSKPSPSPAPAPDAGAEALIAEIQQKLAAATPVDEHAVFARYDHGGGRLYQQLPGTPLHPGDRTLILDVFNEGDRELYFDAQRLLRDAAAALASLQREHETLRAERDAAIRRQNENAVAAVNVAEMLKEAQAESQRLREALQQARTFYQVTHIHAVLDKALEPPTL